MENCAVSLVRPVALAAVVYQDMAVVEQIIAILQARTAALITDVCVNIHRIPLNP